MRKSIIALMGLFTLFACSDEVIQDVDKQSENPEIQMGVNSIDPNIPYESPFDNQSCCTSTEYVFINNTTDLLIESYAYFGVARYDGADDLDHNRWDMTYYAPNLILNGVSEYLKLLKCQTNVGVGPGIFSSGATAQGPIDYPGSQLLMFTALPAFNLAYSPSFLYEYGKLYAYDISIMDQATGTYIFNELLRFPFLPAGVTDATTLSPDWTPIAFPPGATAPEQEDLWYNIYTNEICIGNDYVNHPGGGAGLNDKRSEAVFNYNGKDYEIKLYTTSKEFVVELNEI